jgi:alcohol dehydrogenase
MGTDVAKPTTQTAFSFRAATRLIAGPGTIGQLGLVAADLGGNRVLVVSDPGVIAAGHVRTGLETLAAAGCVAGVFSDFTENPTTAEVEAGTAFARDFRPDLIVGLGGGSSMDCAKGINFLLGGGGRMQDYRGRGTAHLPLLPSIGCPTTAGTGSETQSFALISDAETGEKLACGNPAAAFRVAILDPLLTLTQPPRITALTGIDAISHALESHVSTAATPASKLFSREAWRLLARHLPRVLDDSSNLAAREAVQLGAAWAGLAIENAMLGAAHALANPLTAGHSVAHGQAVGLMLPHVVRFNADAAAECYAELAAINGIPDRSAAGLADWLDELLARAGLARALPECIAASGSAVDIDRLATEAAGQWTGSFNPRPCTAADFGSLYRQVMP